MVIPYRSEVISLRQNDNEKVRTDFLFTLFDFKTTFKRGGDRYEIRRSFRFLKFTMNLIGILPVTINEATKNYEFRWSKFAPIHCLLSILWLTVIVVTSFVGICFYFPTALLELSSDYSRQFVNSTALPSATNIYSLFRAEDMGVLVALGSVYNAWVQSFTIFYRRYDIANFLNNWSHKIFAKKIDPMFGLFKFSTMSCLLIHVFAAFLLLAGLIGRPALLVGVFDAFGGIILMGPHTWVNRSSLTKKVVRTISGFSVVYSFMIHKVTIVAFATNCKLLANSFSCWRNQLKNAIVDRWKDDENGIVCGPTKCFRDLSESHANIVLMLRDLEHIFHPILQFYYASTVVSQCTMLYFMAFQLAHLEKSLTLEEYVWQGSIFFQSVLIFCVVSLSASHVNDEAEKCMDTVRRGLPFSAPEHDQYYFSEVVRCVTLAPLAISGNRYFVITKPFILTIIGVVISYFIIILQLNNT